MSQYFGPELTEPVRMHVAAKRYLAATEDGYFDLLSDASKLSLKLQGGPMTPEQAQAFEAEPFFADAVRLRRWDEEGKIVELPGADAGAFRGCREGLFEVALREGMRDRFALAARWLCGDAYVDAPEYSCRWRALMQK